MAAMVTICIGTHARCQPRALIDSQIPNPPKVVVFPHCQDWTDG